MFTPPLVTGDPGQCGCGCAHTEETTLGFDAVGFAEGIVKIKLRPWQRWLLIHALELAPDGSFRFRKLVVLVARQNGKSILSVILSLYFMYVLEAKTVLSAAQDLDTAEEIWQDGVDLVTGIDEDTEEPLRPELAAFYSKTVLVNGKKALVLTTGERWKVKAANRKAGRGLRGDLIVLDELREHQNWSAWSAITKTTNARPNAQVWTFSNAGDITSVVLRHLRLMAHKKLGDPDGVVAAEAGQAVGPDEFDLEQAIEDNPELEGTDLDELEVDDDSLFLAEWSAAPGRDKWDREGWAEANPSLGFGDNTEKTIASDCATDPEWEFRTEVLCQWPDGALAGIYEAGAWEKTLNKAVEGPDGRKSLDPMDRIVGDVVAAFDVSRDGSRAYIAWAGRRPDGVLQAEVVAAQPGLDWIGPWLMEHAGRIESVSAQERGAPASDVQVRLQADRQFTIPVLPIGGSRLTAVHGRVAEMVKKGQVRHNEQPALDNSVALAQTRDLGDNEVLSRKTSQGDASPAIAWEFAVFQAVEPAPFTPPPPPPPKAVASGEPAARQRDFDPVTAGF